jgi:hypothetical protein
MTAMTTRCLLVWLLAGCTPAQEPAVVVPTATATATAPATATASPTPKTEAMPTSPAALAEAAFQALQSKSVPDFMKLYPKPEEIRAACGDKTDEDFVKKLSKYEERTRERFEDCHRMGDWSKARLVGYRGGDRTHPISSCPQVSKARDVLLRVMLGDTEIEVMLDDPAYVEGGRMVIADDSPRCRKPGGETP